MRTSLALSKFPSTCCNLNGFSDSAFISEAFNTYQRQISWDPVSNTCCPYLFQTSNPTDNHTLFSSWHPEGQRTHTPTPQRNQEMATKAILSSVETGRQLLCSRPLISSSRRVSFVVRAASTPPVKQDANRQLWFASKQSLSYLDGSLPGDYGFDPLGLSDPEGTGGFIEPKWLAYGEIINGRYAMLGVVGCLAPEILGKAGLIPAETALPWFKTGVFPPAGTYSYWADPYTLFVFEMALMGFAEHRRFQDWAKPGSMGKQYFLGFEKFLGGSGEPAYPGGPLFNPLGFGKDEKSLKELKLKEVKNGRLAMLAILGFFIQAIFTGVGPYQNLLDHLADPYNNNILTNLNFHWG